MTVTILCLGVLLVTCGCSGKANNPATRYADNLHNDVKGAEKAAEKANTRINQFDNTYHEKNPDNE